MHLPLLTEWKVWGMYLAKCYNVHLLLVFHSCGIPDMYRGRILGRNWDKSLKNVPPCNSQSPLLAIPPPLRKRGLKLVWSIVYANLKSENSQDYAINLNEIASSWIRLQYSHILYSCKYPPSIFRGQYLRQWKQFLLCVFLWYIWISLRWYSLK